MNLKDGDFKPNHRGIIYVVAKATRAALYAYHNVNAYYECKCNKKPADSNTYKFVDKAINKWLRSDTEFTCRGIKILRDKMEELFEGINGKLKISNDGVQHAHVSRTVAFGEVGNSGKITLLPLFWGEVDQIAGKVFGFAITVPTYLSRSTKMQVSDIIHEATHAILGAIDGVVSDRSIPHLYHRDGSGVPVRDDNNTKHPIGSQDRLSHASSLEYFVMEFYDF